MKNVSVEKKLQLVNQVRSQYRQDQRDLRLREQILYGRDYVPYEPYEEEEFNEAAGGTTPFRLRVMATLVVFVLILMLDRNDRSIFGISSQQIFESISVDYTGLLQK